MIVRFDDYPSGVTPTLENHRERMAKVLQPFEEGRIPYVLAVVPALIDREDIEFLKTLKQVEVALHGFDHNKPVWTGCERVEFRGVGISEVQRKIDEGLEILEDFDVRFYVPPFNALTKEVLRVLEGHPKISDITTGPRQKIDTTLRAWTPKKALYGKSTQIVKNIGQLQRGDHLAFHITWEVTEKERMKDNWKMYPILDRLQEVYGGHYE